ncbi:MAG: hypothetical protein O2931_15185 [Planctomycetota bacterium]|nr:hypothetical protein [Planctomycetota bacterium]MDA1180126.1 hypothetical protein [Planctomycetota bacterium]
MDPLHFVVATIPLAIYFACIGLINLIGRPLVVSGVGDASLLALALSGWVLVGPMELFLPDDAVAQYGVWVWLPIACLYLLMVLLVILLMRPRLIVYNVSSDQLRPLLAQTVVEMDDRARWAGDCLNMPQQGVLLHLDAQPGIRQVQLTAVGGRQDMEAWRRLSRALSFRTKEMPIKANTRGAIFLLAGIMLLLTVGIICVTRSTEVAAAWREILLR